MTAVAAIVAAIVAAARCGSTGCATDSEVPVKPVAIRIAQILTNIHIIAINPFDDDVSPGEVAIDPNHRTRLPISSMRIFKRSPILPYLSLQLQPAQVEVSPSSAERSDSVSG